MTRRAIIIAALIAMIAVPVLATDPFPGTYTSIDAGFGSQNVLTGRGSNSRPVPDLGVDNVFNAHSWNGSVLATQWVFTCGISTSQTTVYNLDGSGTGTIDFTTNYSGGTFWLDKDGPWGDHVNDLTGTINSLKRETQLTYVLGEIVGAVENVYTTADFDNSSCVIEFLINNNVGLGDTDSDPPLPNVLPAGYPPFLDLNCAATRNDGSWGDIRDLQFRIDCTIPTTESTWGHVKSLYE